jgi:flagellar biosynthesis protein
MKKKEPLDSSIDMAAALHYRSDQDNAPKVMATGKGDLARKIKEIALKENIPVYRDTVLAQALVKLGAGTEIPEALYQAVAQVLVHISRLDRKLKY